MSGKVNEGAPEGMMRRRCGLTFVEVVVVVAIVGLLFLLVMMGVSGPRKGSKKAKTQVILAVIRKGIELHLANRGGSMASIEHPFAGSRAPRWRFVRAADGSAVAAEGDALMTDPLRVGDPEARARTLARDDVYADERFPFLFGMPRSRIGIFGVPNPRVSSVRKLSPSEGAAPLLPPYDDTQYPGSWWPSPTSGSAAGSEYADASRLWMEQIFSSSSVLAELSGLGALIQTPANQPRFNQPVDEQSLNGVPMPLAYVAKNEENIEPYWKPGTVKMSMAGKTAALWYRYRLPGSVLYDAWGNEILFSVKANGDIAIESAGADGVFRWNPGKNHRLETDARATSPAGDDADGRHDNLFEGSR